VKLAKVEELRAKTFTKCIAFMQSWQIHPLPHNAQKKTAKTSGTHKSTQHEKLQSSAIKVSGPVCWTGYHPAFFAQTTNCDHTPSRR
jgi:hypothetical protein